MRKLCLLIVVAFFCAAGTAAAQSADLSISITDHPDPVSAGTDLSYLFLVANHSPHAAADVVVTANVPVGLTLRASGGGLVTFDPVSRVLTGRLSSPNGALGAGSEARIGVGFLVDSSFVAGSVLTLSGSVSTSTPDPNPQNNSDSEATTTSPPMADLVVTKSGSPERVAPGSRITYTLSVRNIGSADAQNVVLTDALPAAVSLISLTQTEGPSATITPPHSSSSAATVTIPTLSAEFRLVRTRSPNHR